MAETIIYTQCPCCNSNNIIKHLSAKDNTASNEIFEIFKCVDCTLAFTQNIPVQSKIGKYYQSANYISHSDTKQGIVSKIYHAVRNITLVSKKNIVKKYTKKQTGNLLDVGAGTGAFVNAMQLANWQVTGLEPDEIAIANAKNKYEIELQNPENLFNQNPANFDAVTLWHVLEHIHTLPQYLQQFHTILKQDGKLFIAVPNYTSFDADYYQEFWAAYDVPRHLYHFSPKSMEILANKFNFKIEKTLPMWFDSAYVAMLSEQYKNGRSNLLNAYFIGMISNAKALFNNKKCSSVIYVLQKK
jgi:2-polyprenyl-3-methyl-5-hydroxy-6-metoxy-1,4-benzoquinol methylase